MSKKTVIVITGPTASGKSALGIEVAKRINGEIISADSMQIYKGLDVGTAKVSEADKQGIKHHMLDICEISDKYSVANYKEDCYQCISDILNKGKVPIIVGGTGLYINAVVNNVQFIEEDDKLKEEYERIFNSEYSGKTDDELLNILRKETKIDIEKIKGNRRRIERYFIKYLMNECNNSNNLWTKKDGLYNFLVLYIDVNRDLLYSRIDNRVEQMVDLGIVEEAKELYKHKDKNTTAIQAIGYKELFPFFDNEKTLKDCVETLKTNTRHYAKRQITWFKKLQPKVTIKLQESIDNMVDNVLKEYYETI